MGLEVFLNFKPKMEVLNPESDLTKSFWFTPLTKYKNYDPWYRNLPVGRYKCATFVKRFMEGR